ELGTARLPLPDTAQLAPTSSLMIANPFRRGTFGVGNLFSTHPPMDERIRRLQEMAQAGGTATGGN
ncbi:MAG TPA: hypothetical protein VHX15_09800, partial [Frankiaceae bacterium]|nr:hypothetical protein [Frankiaceae bacterium]